MNTKYQAPQDKAIRDEAVFRRQRELLQPSLKFAKEIGRMEAFRHTIPPDSRVKVYQTPLKLPVRPKRALQRGAADKLLVDLDHRLMDAAIEEHRTQKNLYKRLPGDGGAPLHNELVFRRPQLWDSNLEGGGRCVRVSVEPGPLPPVDTGLIHHSVDVPADRSRAALKLYHSISGDGCTDGVPCRVNHWVQYRLDGPTEDFHATDLELDLWGLGYGRINWLDYSPDFAYYFDRYPVDMKVSVVITQILMGYDPERDEFVTSFRDYMPLRNYRIWNLIGADHAESGILFDLIDVRFPVGFHLPAGDDISHIYATVRLETEIMRQYRWPVRFNFNDHPLGIYLEKVKLIDASSRRVVR